MKFEFTSKQSVKEGCIWFPVLKARNQNGLMVEPLHVLLQILPPLLPNFGQMDADLFLSLASNKVCTEQFW